MLPALYIDGKLVTGLTHGEAFEKLSRNEKNLELSSGFYDSEKSVFFGDSIKFYVKEIILIRHAASGEFYNSTINDLGRNQANLVAAFLSKNEFSKFQGFTSPILRCVQTAKIIEEVCKIGFTTENRLEKKKEEENQEDFLKRLENVLADLPKQSIIVSHSDVVQECVSIVDASIKFSCIPNCSVTHIKNQEIIWAAKDFGIEGIGQND